MRAHPKYLTYLLTAGFCGVLACVNNALSAPLDFVWQDPIGSEQKIAQYGKNLRPEFCPPLDANQELSLNDVVTMALCYNPASRTSYLGLRADADAYGSSMLEHLPIPTASATASWSDSATFGDHTKTRTLSRSSSVGTEMSVVLYDFGKREASIAAAEQTLIASGHTYNSTMQGIIGQALLRYYSLLTQQSALTSAQATKEFAQKSLEAAKLKFEVELAPIADVISAENSFSQAELTLQQAENAERQSRADLAVLLGVEPTTPLKVKALSEEELNTGPMNGQVEQLIEKAKANRADIAAQFASLESARASLRATQRSNLPSVKVSASESFDNLNVFNKITERSQGIGVSVSIPLFDGFSKQYSQRAAEKRLESQEISYEEAVRNVARDVFRAWHDYQTAEASWRTTASLIRSAEQTQKIALARYSEGVGNILELLNAQSQYTSALQSRTSSMFTLLTTRVDLIRAVGILNLETLPTHPVQLSNNVPVPAPDILPPQ